MNWQRAVEETVNGLGYDLVDADKSVGGLLRVFIDHPPSADGADVGVPRDADTQAAEPFITVDDCERVTRQLQHVLEVEGCAYARLEVSSPGLDRPLKKAADYLRFVGHQVELTLKLPFKGRKKYRGELHQTSAEGWQLLMTHHAVARAGAGATRVSRRAVTPVVVESEPAGQGGASADLALDFSLDEVREARLVPDIDFKGRRFAAVPETASGSRAGPNDELDGGGIQ